MNRFKKEEIKRGKSPNPELSGINDLAQSIHIEKFPEEYDFMLDSIADLNDRGRGINPMSDEYITKVDAKRKTIGVSPLSESGMPTSNDTRERATTEAKVLLATGG